MDPCFHVSTALVFQDTHFISEIFEYLVFPDLFNIFYLRGYKPHYFILKNERRINMNVWVYSVELRNSDCTIRGCLMDGRSAMLIYGAPQSNLLISCLFSIWNGFSHTSPISNVTRGGFWSFKSKLRVCWTKCKRKIKFLRGRFWMALGQSWVFS